MPELLILLWLTRIAVTDVRSLRIPNPQIWPGVCAVAAVSLVNPGVGGAALLAALPYALGFALGWCGGGDVKLAAVCGGLTLRWDAALMMLLSASTVALVSMLVVGVRARRTGRDGPRRHPHAPALVVATLLASPVP